MLFNTLEFVVFFAVVFGFYCALSHRWQNRMLLVASYVFYGAWDYRFCSLMAITTIADFFISNAPHASENEKTRRRWLLASISLNLVILGFFKYFNFFIDSAHTLLTNVGFEFSPVTLSIVLPVGISFYTFQEMSYVIDVYRKRITPAKSLSDFALFVSFFPQLVAGPIERSQNLLGQIEQPRRMTWDGWCDGATLFLIGLFKKVAVADVLAPIVEQAFSNPASHTPFSLLFALYCFSFQIYSDFSGYTDMARGIAKFMGFELMENFNQPYFASNITDFWRRWHISLSTWLRDYLYIPLGGNRYGTFKTYRNLFLTMFLGGLWHGASWTFAIWGSLHGLYLAVHKFMLDGRKPAEAKSNALLSLVKIVIVFHLVALTWIFFRAETFANSFAYLKGLFVAGGTNSFDADTLTSGFLAIFTLITLIDIPQFMRNDHCVMLKWPFPRRVLAFTALSVWLLLMRGTENAPFIYFQF
ncbi:MAG TPA: MBOAT family protein [Planctomycetota bacterium]|nr:MBOAT family protein [Planctomycetota bacterium]